MQPIQIVYEEPHFLLVNKPTALFSQAPAGIDSLQARLIAQLKARDQHPGEPFVGLPHRLDRGTSGIMLIARNQRALKRFGQQFQSRKVIKHYVAVVEGAVPQAGAVSSVHDDAGGSHHQSRNAAPQGEQLWEDYLRKIPGLPQAEVVTAEAEGAKLAVARVECLYRASGHTLSTSNAAEQAGDARQLSLLKIELETGRMHQIRVQAASRGLPVVGDAGYGATLSWSHDSIASQSTVSERAGAAPVASPTAEGATVAQPTVDAAAASQVRTGDAHGHPPVALHAWSLEFRHPQTARSMRFVAPVPASWQQLPEELLARLARLG